MIRWAKQVALVLALVGQVGVMLLLCSSTLASVNTPRTGEYKLTGKPVSPWLYHSMCARELTGPGWSDYAFPNKGYSGNNPEDSIIRSHYLVYVPPNYRLNGSWKSWGLLVNIFPINHCNIPGGWKTICRKHHLILIIPQNVGNVHNHPWRLALAIKSVAQIKRRYKYNPARTYIVGASGGARVASEAGTLCSDVFTGAICNCGVDRLLLHGYPQGIIEDEFCTLPRFARLAHNQTRFFLYTGTKDINERETLKTYKWMKAKGYRYVACFDQPGGTHAGMSNDNFVKGLDFLDQPLTKGSGRKLALIKLLIRRGAIGRAMWLAKRQMDIAPGTPPCNAAKRQFDKLLVDYTAALLKLKAFANKQNTVVAINKRIVEFSEKYMPYASRDILALRRAMASRP